MKDLDSNKNLHFLNKRPFPDENKKISTQRNPLKSLGVFVPTLVVSLSNLWQSILFMIFFFLIPFSLFAKERIGVMDFIESEGLPRDTGKTAATHAIIALLDSQKYTVIEKSTVEFILKEQALQKKGCTDTDCAIQTGKLIAANLMLTGNIIELNKKIIVSINIRNIEQGKVEFSETMSIASLKELEFTITGSIERFVAKKNKPSLPNVKQVYTELPPLTDEQRFAVLGTYLFPGFGHLIDGQAFKGMFFMSAFIYSTYNFLELTPLANRESRKDIIQDYRGGIAILGTTDTYSQSGKNNAAAMFGILYRDELKREWEMHTRSLNSGYLLLAILTIIHTDMHFTILDNYFLKSFQNIYLNTALEKGTNPNFENRNFAARHELTFKWRF